MWASQKSLLKVRAAGGIAHDDSLSSDAHASNLEEDGAVPPLEKVLALVMCCEKYRDSKEFVLMTWLRQLHVATRINYVFVFGDASLSTAYKRCGDELFVRTPDDYVSFNRKVKAAFEWACQSQEFSHCTHVWKVDDDVLVNARLICNYLENALDVPSCGVYLDTPPEGDRWYHGEYDVKLNLGAYAGPYYEGPSYVLRRDVLEHFVNCVTEVDVKEKQAEDKMVADVVRRRFPPTDHSWGMRSDCRYNWHDENYPCLFKDAIVASNVRGLKTRLEFIANAKRTVLCYWDKGYSAMPELVRHVLDLNYKLCQRYGYNLILCDDATVGNAIKLPACFDQIAPNYKSDVIRWIFLHEYGGIWIDCDVVILRKLDKHFESPFDLELYGESPEEKSGYKKIVHGPTQTTYASCILVMRRRSYASRLAVESLGSRLAKSVPKIGKTEWTYIGPDIVAELAQNSELSDLIRLVPFNISQHGECYIQWYDVYSKSDYLKNRNKFWFPTRALAEERAATIREQASFFILWKVVDHAGIELFHNRTSLVHHMCQHVPGVADVVRETPRLVFIMAPPRSGTQTICRLLNNQKVGQWQLKAYYEFSNSKYYNGEWGTSYYTKYGTTNKLDTLLRIVNLEADRRVIPVVKMFYGEQGLTNNELEQLVEKVDVRFVFIEREMKEVYSSLYRAFTQNDWTERRQHPLPLVCADELRKNEAIRWLQDNGVHESFVEGKKALFDALGIPYTELRFVDFTQWVRNEYRNFVEGLW